MKGSHLLLVFPLNIFYHDISTSEQTRSHLKGGSRPIKKSPRSCFKVFLLVHNWTLNAMLIFIASLASGLWCNKNSKIDPEEHWRPNQ